MPVDVETTRVRPRTLPAGGERPRHDAAHRRGFLHLPREASAARAHQFKYSGAAIGLSVLVSVTQLKLAAALVAPLPLYFGTCGNGQIGRCITMPNCGTSLSYLVAMMLVGAIPCSTHCSSASSASCRASSEPAGGGAA